MKEKKNTEGLTLLNFKTYYNQDWILVKEQINGMEDTDPRYRQVQSTDFWQRCKDNTMKNPLYQRVLEQPDIHLQKS